MRGWGGWMGGEGDEGMEKVLVQRANRYSRCGVAVDVSTSHCSGLYRIPTVVAVGSGGVYVGVGAKGMMT